MKFVRKQLVIAGLSAFLTLGMVNIASAALSLAEQADRTSNIVGSGLVNLGGLDVLGKANIVVKSTGSAIKAVVGAVDSPLASLIAQSTYNASNKYKLGMTPRMIMDRVRFIWGVKETVVIRITLADGKLFTCTVTGRGGSLTCDEEPVSRG